jgi:MoxR-like ATPase
MKLSQPDCSTHTASLQGEGFSTEAEDLLSQLGVFGVTALQPVLLAALLNESPLLLIGAHGSGKSLLLERIAHALSLRWRHYNASLLNFDDLVGYPLPDAHGQLKFVHTPASIWGAQAVFMDEISRARLDMQNRLFPIVHECKVQGIPLQDLRYRWAAMNPPATPYADPGSDSYAGSQPLDVALADRFGWHVTLPEWQSHSREIQDQIIQAKHSPVDLGSVGKRLGAALAHATTLVPLVHLQWLDVLTRYVRVCCGLLGKAGYALSARRAGILLDNIVAVHAMSLALKQHDGNDKAMAEDAWLTLQNSIPLAASGMLVPLHALLISHKEAWRQASASVTDPIGLLLNEPDAVKRVQRAVSSQELHAMELSSIVCDSLAQLSPGASHAVATWLVDSGVVERLPVLAAEVVGTLYREVHCVQEFRRQVPSNSFYHRLWTALTHRLAGLDPALAIDQQQANLLSTLYIDCQLRSVEQLDAVWQDYLSTSERLGILPTAATGAQ